MRHRCCLWLICLLLLPTARAAGDGLALLVPAYFGPTSGRWQPLAEAAPRVPLVVIANIYNGPGEGSQPLTNYVQAIRAVQTNGGQVIGYVYTQYEKRPIEVVKEAMRRWHALYGVDGFFVDEMSNDGSETSLKYYGDLANHAHALHPALRLVANPGTNTRESYLRARTADTLVIFEHHTGYTNFQAAAWTKAYSQTHFAHLPYGVPASQMTNYLARAVSQHAGFIYVTDDGGNNPWDTLPSYWEAEVAWVEAENRSAAERVQARLQWEQEKGPVLSLKAEGAVGRYILEASSPLGDWEALRTNLTNSGTSVWQILNIPANRFFRLRQ